MSAGCGSTRELGGKLEERRRDRHLRAGTGALMRAATDVRPFADRHEAGVALGNRLAAYGGRDDVVVLALPRGGVPVGYEVARALGAPLDVFLVRKLGVPGREELAMGAIASGGVRVINEDVVSELRIPARWIDATAAQELAELRRREVAYRDGRPAP